MEAPYSHLEKGTLLIASPEVDSGFFFRSVILVCEHTLAGSFGLVINKDLDATLPDDLLSPTDMVNPNLKIKQGGPVQTNQMMLLHTSSSISDQTLEVCPDVFLGGDLTFLQDSVLNEKGPDIFLCFGYAGWGSGQLEKEFLDGEWFLHPGSKEWIFKTPPSKIWQKLLRQMGGKYASISMIPENLSLN